MKYFIVGAGIYGSVLARSLAEKYDNEVIVIDKRDTVGGNCISFFDDRTGIECHKYGSHIFHTSNETVWNFVNKFTKFTNYVHRVFTKHKNIIYSLPINLGTINQFFNKSFSPMEAREFITREISKDVVKSPSNLEEKAISLIGKQLYTAFIKGYTTKQWGRAPKDLSADIITRLPVRFTYNSNYFENAWQGLPAMGYKHFFDNLLDHPKISLLLNTPFQSIRNNIPKDCTVIYTGNLDELFDYKYGELEWRSLRFEWEHIDIKDFQGTPVMNYADTDEQFTRIHEFKHFHPERKSIFTSDKTIICYEFPQDYNIGKERYYPINTDRNNILQKKYEKELSSLGHYIPGGRLGAYKYWDMDKAVEAALSVADTLCKTSSI